MSYWHMLYNPKFKLTAFLQLFKIKIHTQDYFFPFLNRCEVELKTNDGPQGKAMR